MQLARASALLLRGGQTGTATTRLLQQASRPAALEASRLGLQPKPSRAPVRCSSSSGGGGESRPTAGELHVCVGPMFSGKTTSLLKFMAENEKAHKRCMLIKSAKDTRSAADRVKAHTGEEKECQAESSLENLYESERYKAAQVIGIDEAQFFPDLLNFCRRSVDVDKKVVFVAGLDGDYRREKFGDVLSLIPIADTVEKLHGNCGVCGKAKSIFTLRTVGVLQVELIGGGESYKPVCRACYTSNMPLPGLPGHGQAPQSPLLGTTPAAAAAKDGTAAGAGGATAAGGGLQAAVKKGGGIQKHLAQLHKKQQMHRHSS